MRRWRAAWRACRAASESSSSTPARRGVGGWEVEKPLRGGKRCEAAGGLVTRRSHPRPCPRPCPSPHLAAVSTSGLHDPQAHAMPRHPPLPSSVPAPHVSPSPPFARYPFPPTRPRPIPTVPLPPLSQPHRLRMVEHEPLLHGHGYERRLLQPQLQPHAPHTAAVGPGRKRGAQAGREGVRLRGQRCLADDLAICL